MDKIIMNINNELNMLQRFLIENDFYGEDKAPFGYVFIFETKDFFYFKWESYFILMVFGLDV